MIRSILVLAALAAAATDSIAAQAPTLRPGAVERGVLQASDPQDADGFTHDEFGLVPDGANRVLVTVESDDFAPFLEVGVLNDGVFDFRALQDGSPLRANSGVAELFVPFDLEPWADGAVVVRVSSADAGPDGAYTVRVEERPAPESQRAEVTLPTRRTGSLTQSDAMVRDLTFEDAYRFRGQAGRRILVTMTADFDAYLRLKRIGPDGPHVVAEDDDGFGGSDAFLEVDLIEDGEYEISANSYHQAFGDYALEVWDADPLVPAIAESAQADPAISEAEADAITVTWNEVRNDRLGFRVPAPLPDLRQSPAAAAMLASAETPPNMAVWLLHDGAESAVLTVFAVRLAGPVTRDRFALIASKALEGELEASPQLREYRVVVPPTVDWSTRSFVWAAEAQSAEVEPDEPRRMDMWCEASGPDRRPGLMVCLLGGAVDGASWSDALQGLEIDGSPPPASRPGDPSDRPSR